MLGLQLKNSNSIPTTLQTGDVIHLRIVAGFLIIGVMRNAERLRVGATEEVSIQLVTNAMRDEFPKMDHVARVIAGLLLLGGISFHKNVCDSFTATITIV